MIKFEETTIIWVYNKLTMTDAEFIAWKWQPILDFPVIPDQYRRTVTAVLL